MLHVVVAAAVVVAAGLLFESHEIPFWPRMPLQQPKVPHEQQEEAAAFLPLPLSLPVSLPAALVSISAAKPVERLTVQHATSWGKCSSSSSSRASPLDLYLLLIAFIWPTTKQRQPTRQSE